MKMQRFTPVLFDTSSFFNSIQQKLELKTRTKKQMPPLLHQLPHFGKSLKPSSEAVISLKTPFKKTGDNRIVKEIKILDRDYASVPHTEKLRTLNHLRYEINKVVTQKAACFVLFEAKLLRIWQESWLLVGI